ncbi:MAG: AAA family ATPase [Candidatus Aegiribacteria sp.]|nr:AAA family ATPase [Candidatus Aegiribacteria sp.]
MSNEDTARWWALGLIKSLKKNTEQTLGDHIMPSAPAPRAPKIAPPAPPLSNVVAAAPRNFTVAPWTGEGDGEKIIIYGPSGMGKTTLAAMAPDPVFIGCDDGGRRIRNPLTGEPVLHVPGIANFRDVQDALRSHVFDDHTSVVIDTGTVLQDWAIPHILTTVKHEKGYTVHKFEDYGYGKGFTHLYEAMYSIPVALERLVHMGKNIILLCQLRGSITGNAGGDDYVKTGPALYPGGKKGTNNIQAMYCEWVDHIFRIDWEGATVTDGKIAPVSTRMVRVHPDATFEAKSRSNVFAEYPAVTFSKPNDDSLWRILFGGR